MSFPNIADIPVGAGRLARTHTRFYPGTTYARGTLTLIAILWCPKDRDSLQEFSLHR